LAIVTTLDGERPDFMGLRRALQDRVARFWIPEYWAQIDGLPLTSVGKIDKQALREAFAPGKSKFEKIEDTR
jgi:fatty-acyl-CoA synthase